MHNLSPSPTKRVTHEKHGRESSGSGQSRFRNVFAVSSAKSMYANLKSDVTTATSAVPRLKANEKFLAIPWTGGKASLGLFPTRFNQTDSIRVDSGPPIMIAHHKALSDLEWSPLHSSILATASREDGLVRIWKLPSEASTVDFDENHTIRRHDIDTPSCFLAGHEKKLETLKFHPTVGSILATASADCTVKLWDVDAVEDKLTISTNHPIHSITYDYCGDLLAATSADGSVMILDPRHQETALAGIPHNHSQSKPSKVQWLNPEQYICTSGFTAKGTRELAMWDVRNFHTSLQTIPIDGTGTGQLSTFWDQSLPILYVASKGEGMRIFELLDGILSFVTMVKSDKQISHLDLLSKTICNTKKCEIARFARLGTDNTIDSVSLIVPRTAGESVFQTDLYPAIATVDPEGSTETWFARKETVQPLLVEFIPESDKKDTTPSSANLPKPSLIRTPTVHLIDPTEFTESLQKSNTIRRSASKGRAHSRSISKSVKRAPILIDTKSSATESSISPESGAEEEFKSKEGAVLLEKRGWFGSIWEPRHLVLKTTRIYLYLTQTSESPLKSLSLKTIKQLEIVSPDIIGLETITGQAMSFKCKDHRDWLIALSKVGLLVPKELITPKETAKLLTPKSVEPEIHEYDVLAKTSLRNSHARESSKSEPDITHGTSHGATPLSKVAIKSSAALFTGELAYMPPNQETSKPTLWPNKFVVLDFDVMLHIYQDEKAFITRQQPTESFNLSTFISIHKCPADETTFQVMFAKRSCFFHTSKASNCSDWVQQLRQALITLDVDSTRERAFEDPICGWAQMKSGDAQIKPGRYWLAFFPYSGFYYFQTPLSTTAAHFIPVNSFKGVVSSDSNLKQELCVDITFEGRIINHEFPDVNERNRWLDALKGLRLSSFHLLSHLGITTMEALRSDVLENAEDPLHGIITLADYETYKAENNSILIQVAGKAHLTIQYVKNTYQSLRSDCAYVLDKGMTIYHWGGPLSSRVARAKALDLSSSLRKERGNKPRVILVEDDEPQLIQGFFQDLQATINDKHPCSFYINNLSAWNQDDVNVTKIFLVDAEAQNLQKSVKWIYEGVATTKNVLKTEKVFVIQVKYEIFVWMGKQSKLDDRKLGSGVGRALAATLHGTNTNDGSKIVVLQKANDGREPVMFKEKFVDYEGTLPISMRIDYKAGNIAQAMEQPPIDVKALLSPLALAEPKFDDGKSGKVEFYLIRQFEKEFVHESLKDVLFREESYIIKYTYFQGQLERNVIYFWQGAESTITQKGTSAFITVELSKETKGDIEQIRVVEGKEPTHLQTIFGEIIVRLGPLERHDQRSPMAFDIRSLDGRLCKARETFVSDIQFNSNHVIVLRGTGNSVYIWSGRNSLDVERKFAENRIVAKFFPKCNIVHVKEGEASEAANGLAKELKSSKVEVPGRVSTRRVLPRLFLCTSRSGIVTVEEVPQFIQEDLDEGAVMILMSEQEGYVWFGPRAKTNEKIVAMETLEKYAQQSEAQVQLSDLFVTSSQLEPLEFKRQFHGWSNSRAPSKSSNDVESKLPPVKRPLYVVLKEFKETSFPASVLLGDPEHLPEHVDVTHLENYLIEEEFLSIFKMPKQEYLALPQWKRDRVKQEVGFF